MEKPHIIAFYLPQYRPVKENNEWFGEGFTEWTNVAKAKPLFKGHVQPKIPADLGFYDLRLPEVREKQAKLAKEAGVSAFCYYHYWFGNGKKILHETLEEVVAAKKPDFPFCICWANHSWYKKNWNPDLRKIEQDLILEQTYPGDLDVVDHFYYLLPMFKDPRYYKIDGRLVFTIYNIKEVPDFRKVKETWNKLARDNNLPEFYFIGNTNNEKETDSSYFDDCDNVILSMVAGINNKQDFSKFSSYKRAIIEKIAKKFNLPLEVYEYRDAINYMITDKCREQRIIPTIVPNWDYTARRGAGGLILKNSEPKYFGLLVNKALDYIKCKKECNQIIFIKSWNEWGEGNYMEPDSVYGHGYLEVLSNCINEYIRNN